MLNSKDLFKIIGQIDDDLILRSENAENNKSKSKKLISVFAAAISIGLCVVILTVAIIIYGGSPKNSGDNSNKESSTYSAPTLSGQSWADDDIHYEHAIEPVS